MFDSKKLAASCAAVASLAMFGLSGTAMAVETPTTADTATASITLNAAEGNTLNGHTFTFYRLGSYGDITAGTSGTDVKSLTVNKIDDASDKWIAAANTKAGITDRRASTRQATSPTSARTASRPATCRASCVRLRNNSPPRPQRPERTARR